MALVCSWSYTLSGERRSREVISWSGHQKFTSYTQYLFCVLRSTRYTEVSAVVPLDASITPLFHVHNERRRPALGGNDSSLLK